MRKDWWVPVLFFGLLTAKTIFSLADKDLLAGLCFIGACLVACNYVAWVNFERAKRNLQYLKKRGQM